MSCNTNSLKAKLNSARAGIGGLSSNAANISGALVASTQRGLGRVASAALVVANAIDGPKTIDRLTPLAVIGSIAGDVQAGRASRAARQTDEDGENYAARTRPPNWRFRTLNVIAALQLARAGSTGLGLALARLSRPKDSAVQTRAFFNGRESVTVRSWDSRLSAALNAADVGPAARITASFGRMVESNSQAWHTGTTLVHTPQGERAVTHLQSINWPAQHYYFSRPLTDLEVAGVISGNKAFDPKHLPGFAGEVSEIESLAPLLARSKKGLIKTHLFFGRLKDKG